MLLLLKMQICEVNRLQVVKVGADDHLVIAPSFTKLSLKCSAISDLRTWIPGLGF